MDTLVFYVVMGLTYLFSLVVRKRLNSAYSKYSRTEPRRFKRRAGCA
jgi:hypothetical protein